MLPDVNCSRADSAMDKVRELEHQQAVMKAELEGVKEELQVATGGLLDLEFKLLDPTWVKEKLEELEETKAELEDAKYEWEATKDEWEEAKDELEGEIDDVKRSTARLEIEVIQIHAAELAAPALSSPGRQIHFQTACQANVFMPPRTCENTPQHLEAARQDVFPGTIQMYFIRSHFNAKACVNYAE